MSRNWALPSLLDEARFGGRSGGYYGRGGFGPESRYMNDYEDNYMRSRYGDTGYSAFASRRPVGFGDSRPSFGNSRSSYGGFAERSGGFSERMGGFSERSGDFDDRKKEILMDLGETLIESLKEGRNLSNNPVVRDKIATLLKVEVGPKIPPPAPLSFSKYDAYYDADFIARPKGDSLGGTARLSQKFSRVDNHENDPHRIWASERELFEFLRDRPLFMDKRLKNRIKNTISYEINRETYQKRKNWLSFQYGILSKAKSNRPSTGGALGNSSGGGMKNSTPSFGVSTPFTGNNEVPKRPKRKESLQKREKRKLRDKRPPQDENERYMTNYLKSLLFELTKDEDEEHGVLVLRALRENPKIIQCLMNEVITHLNQRFGSGPDLPMVAQNAKRKFVMDHVKKHMDDTKKHLLEIKKTTKFLHERLALFESIQPILLGKEKPKEPFSSDDYIIEKNKTDDEFVIDFKYLFVRFVFEKFNYKVVETFMNATKNLESRINFFMNNGFIAGLIVDSVKLNAATLPFMAMKYITHMDQPCMQSSTKVNNLILAKVIKKGEVVSTRIEDYITPNAFISSDVGQYFQACIDHFDPKASMLKYQLVDYTPYVRLSKEYKSYVFNEIIKFVYLQCLDYLTNNINSKTKPYVDMLKD